MTDIETVMRLAPVIPVLVLNDVARAMTIAQSLVAGGLHAIEVTLRTPAALEIIAEMAKIDGAVVGAGTVLDRHQLDAAMVAGARFIVSPGLTDTLAKPAIAHGIPFLPGISTAADIMRGLDLGLSHFKFFPAVASGGIPALKALAAPFPHCRFCPTGGITAETAPDWLALEPVICVGGSWIVQADTDPIEIERRSRAARSGSHGGQQN